MDRDKDGCVHEGYGEDMDDDDYLLDDHVEKGDNASFEVATGDDDTYDNRPLSFSPTGNEWKSETRVEEV